MVRAHARTGTSTQKKALRELSSYRTTALGTQGIFDEKFVQVFIVIVRVFSNVSLSLSPHNWNHFRSLEFTCTVELTVFCFTNQSLFHCWRFFRWWIFPRLLFLFADNSFFVCFFFVLLFIVTLFDFVCMLLLLLFLFFVVCCLVWLQHFT